MALHQKRCLNVKDKKCDKCDFEAATETEVKTHKLSKHDENDFHECDICGKKLKSVLTLTQHKTNLHGDKKEQFQCLGLNCALRIC